jgi:hypothetical protein
MKTNMKMKQDIRMNTVTDVDRNTDMDMDIQYHKNDEHSKLG